MAANKAYIASKRNKTAGDVFDLNTFVFGDSAKGDKAIYPVHSSVLYSDAISVQGLSERVDSVFRQGGISEEYVSWDAENQKTSSNIFTTRSVLPGTIFVQSIVALGHRLTVEAIDHLFLSLGLAGSYGGATATTGTNMKTHLLGVYWGSFERSINAPEQILKELGERTVVEDVIESVIAAMSREYPNHIDAQVVTYHVNDLIKRFENNDSKLLEAYQRSSIEMKDLFNAWF